MIRAGIMTKSGPIAVVGINHENKRRMEAGMPLQVDLKAIAPPSGTRFITVFVHYAHTYADVVKDMEEGGLPANEELYNQAKALDEAMPKAAAPITAKQWSILNSLVTFAAENVPGGLSADEREVAQLVGRRALDDTSGVGWPD